MHRLEGGIRQPQLLRIAVHQTNKGFLAARHVISQRDTCIITRLNNNAFVQIGDRYLIAGFQEHH
ncbi:hypothetical protein D3C73_1367600 [compost metagenome]